MKVVLIMLGAILILLAVIRSGKYLFNIESMSGFELGFVLGNAVLFILGLVIMIFGIRRKTRLVS